MKIDDSRLWIVESTSVCYVGSVVDSGGGGAYLLGTFVPSPSFAF